MKTLALWGKTGKGESYHPLLYHLLDVAAVCEALPIRRYFTKVPLDWVTYLVALHDIGKADPYFQNKNESQAERLRNLGYDIPMDLEHFRHEARSHFWLRDYLRRKYGWGRKAANCIGIAIHGHHGNFHSPCGIEDGPSARLTIWDPIREQLADEIANILKVDNWAPQSFENNSSIGVKFAGLIVLADWIASNETMFPSQDIACECDPAAYLDKTRKLADRVIRDLGLEDQQNTCGLQSFPLFKTVWPECEDLRPTQQTLNQLCLKTPPPPGLAIIEAPMGEGKTEAAIYLATIWQQMTGLQGTYLALPTAATSNQMHSRYISFLKRYSPGDADPRLVHGMAWLIDQQTPQGEWNVDEENSKESARAQDWFRPSKRALLARHAVGTIDQALLAALNVKHGFLRLFGLSDKILIVDEAHAYDVYMTTILQRLLEWCRVMGTPVILLSATLSQAQKHMLISAYTGQDNSEQRRDSSAYPLLTFVSPEGSLQEEPVEISLAIKRTVVVQKHRGLLNDPEQIAQLAIKAVSKGGCACVLVNSVAQAQEVFRKLGDAPDTRLLLFHARFSAGKRNTIEKTVCELFGRDISNRPERAILVSTQVVEQSLDVDFDVMISQLAPIDLLLQRSGRLHRHAKKNRPTGDLAVFHILLPEEDGYDFGATGNIYQHEPLLRTLSLLKDSDAFNLPEDFRFLIEKCYGSAEPPAGIDPEVFAKAVEKHLTDIQNELSQAETHLIPLPNDRIFSLGQNTTQTATEPGDEDIGDTASFFHARTRLGDYTCPVLLLHEQALYDKTLLVKAPDRETLGQLFLNKVDLPAWWFNGLKNNEGISVDFKGPSWLKSCLVIKMSEGRWQGKVNNKQGVIVVDIVDDPITGVERIEKSTPTDR